jgi:hypothetical protein
MVCEHTNSSHTTVGQAANMTPFGKQLLRVLIVLATTTQFLSVPLVSAQGVPPYNSTALLIVSEIMINPKGVTKSNGTWFEVYNPSDKPYNLTDHFIDVIGFSGESPRLDELLTPRIPAGAVVPAKGYFVVGNDNNTATNGNVRVDYTLDIQNLSLSETGGGVGVLRQRWDPICLVAWGTLLNEFGIGERTIGKNLTDAPFVAGASMNLKNVAKRVLVGSTITAEDWCVSSATYGSAGNKGTPKAANKCLSDSTKDCGIFGLRIFCPRTMCGIIGHLFGLCKV